MEAPHHDTQFLKSLEQQGESGSPLGQLGTRSREMSVSPSLFQLYSIAWIGDCRRLMSKMMDGRRWTCERCECIMVMEVTRMTFFGVVDRRK